MVDKTKIKSKIKPMPVHGLFGGSFDPVHRGHIETARAIMQQLQLDNVVFVPTARSPFKPSSTTSEQQRATMLKLAIADEQGFTLDTREFERPPPSYTVDTIESLIADYANQRWVLILGMDAWQNFPDWHRPQRILQLVNIVVMTRPGYELNVENALGVKVASLEDLLSHSTGRVLRLSVPPLDISSTRIRALISQGKTFKENLKPEVAQYIKEYSLYHDYVDPSAN